MPLSEEEAACEIASLLAGQNAPIPKCEKCGDTYFDPKDSERIEALCITDYYKGKEGVLTPAEFAPPADAPTSTVADGSENATDAVAESTSEKEGADEEDGDTPPESGSLVLDGFCFQMEGWEDQEARIRDLDLARKLGFPRPRKIRELIRRHEATLAKMGCFLCRTKLVGHHGGTLADMRPVMGRPADVPNAQEYWLTEAQACFIATRSDTPKSDEIAAMCAQAFVALRKLLAGKNTGLTKEELRGELDKRDTAIDRKLDAIYSDVNYTNNQVSMVVSQQQFQGSILHEVMLEMKNMKQNGLVLNGPTMMVPHLGTGSTCSTRELAKELNVPQKFLREVVLAAGIVGDETFGEKSAYFTSHHALAGYNWRHKKGDRRLLDILRPYVGMYNSLFSHHFSTQKGGARMARTHAREAVVAHVTRVGRGTWTALKIDPRGQSIPEDNGSDEDDEDPTKN